MNVINTTEKQIPPAGIRNMVGGDEEKVSFDSQHVETTDGGGEVKMVDNNRRLPLTGPGGPGGSGETGGPGGPDGREEAERMTLTKIDDMWLTEDQLPKKMRSKTGDEEGKIMRGSPGMLDSRYHWPNRILYYHLADWFSSRQRQQIETALWRLERKIGSNCVKFRRSNRWDAVQVRQGDGCGAQVGYVGSRYYQQMSLARGCFRSGTIQHEFLHSLGIYHTQNRWDRDRYVDVLSWKIIPRKKRNFYKQPKSEADSFGLPYDYSSIMHYGGSSFANNKNYPTIVTKDH